MVFELRFAWRETRPSIKKFLFMIGAIALGVAALTGIKGFSESLDKAMHRSARDLIAADLAVRLPSPPSEQEQQVLGSVEARGATITHITETISMASTAGAEKPLLVTVKAVDPTLYPFYGTVETRPAEHLAKLLTRDSAVVSREFLIRTGAATGDTIQVGSSGFRISAELINEPDRISSGFELGPRVFVSRQGLERSGLIQFGSRATESFLFRLPGEGLEISDARELLQTGLDQRARITDYRNPNPSLASGLERMTNYLSLIGLMSLLVGGLGVSTTIHSYIRQKLDTIAILKCLGGRQWQIIRIYLLQGLLIGVIGSVAGVALGYLLQVALPPFVQGMLDLPTELEPAPTAVLQGLLIGVVTTLLFLLPPLLAIRKIRPVRVFLRDMPETHFTTINRLRQDPVPLAFVALLLAGVGLLATWLASSWERGFGFMGILFAAVIILSACAKLLLMILKRVPRPKSLALRHGVKNLYRPGSQVTSVLVALGIGVAFVVTVYLIQTSLISQIVRGAPKHYPNMFLLGITEKDKTSGLFQFVSDHAGIEDGAPPIPSISSYLQRIDGKTPDELELEPRARRYSRSEFVLTWMEELPPDTEIIEGEWWSPPYDRPLISVGSWAAQRFNIRVGSTLEFVSSGRQVAGEVSSIRDFEFNRPGNNNQFVFSPGTLDRLPASYMGAFRVSAGHAAALQRDLFDRFPNVTSVDVGDVLVKVQELMDKISTVIQFVAYFSILSGITILAASIASTRYERIREAALLKTMGATRAQISRIQAAEFLILGLVAGVTGCLLAWGTADYLLGYLLDTPFDFQWVPLLVATIGTAALTIVTGWLASHGILKHKPLEILREN